MRLVSVAGAAEDLYFHLLYIQISIGTDLVSRIANLSCSSHLIQRTQNPATRTRSGLLEVVKPDLAVSLLPPMLSNGDKGQGPFSLVSGGVFLL